MKRSAYCKHSELYNKYQERRKDLLVHHLLQKLRDETDSAFEMYELRLDVLSVFHKKVNYPKLFTK